MRRLREIRSILSQRWVFAILVIGVWADLGYWGSSSPRHTPLLAFCCSGASRTATNPIFPRAIVIEESGVLRVIGKDEDEFVAMRS